MEKFIFIRNTSIQGIRKSSATQDLPPKKVISFLTNDIIQGDLKKFGSRNILVFERDGYIYQIDASSPSPLMPSPIIPYSESNQPSSVITKNEGEDGESFSFKKMILPTIGAASGLFYAYKTKKSTGGYFLYFILGSIAGSLISSVISFNSGNNNSGNKKSTGNAGADPEFEKLYETYQMMATSRNVPPPQKSMMKSKWDSYSQVEKTAAMEYASLLSRISPSDPSIAKKIGQIESDMVKKYGEAVVVKINQ